MMVYICTKFHENILNGIRVMERTRKVNGRRARHNTTRLQRAYKKKGNGQELIQSSLTAQPKTQKGKKHTDISINVCFILFMNKLQIPFNVSFIYQGLVAQTNNIVS